jgi:hypothetical protein
MRRYFIAPVVGTGTSSDPYRPKIRANELSWSAFIPTGPDGHPKLPWCIAYVDGTDLTTEINDAQLFEITDQLDLTVESSLTNQRKNALRTRMATYGVVVPDNTTINPWTMRELLIFIGQALDPAFDPAEMRLTVTNTP